MRAITKCRRAGYTKYPARKREKEKAISFSIDAEQAIEYDSRTHFLAKRTQNGNFFIVGENVVFEYFLYEEFFGYVTPKMDVLRCTSEHEFGFVEQWGQAWEVLPKTLLFELRYNVEIDVVATLYDDEDLPCDLTIEFLRRMNPNQQGASYHLYIERIKMYKKRRNGARFYMDWLYQQLPSLVMPPLCLYNITSTDLSQIRQFFSVRNIDENN